MVVSSDLQEGIIKGWGWEGGRLEALIDTSSVRLTVPHYSSRLLSRKKNLFRHLVPHPPHTCYSVFVSSFVCFLSRYHKTDFFFLCYYMDNIPKDNLHKLICKFKQTS